MIEREIKLPFSDVESARRAVQAAGGRPTTARRFIADRLFDTPDARLRREGRALRVRRDGARTMLTAKGPAPSERVKAREEFETSVGGAEPIEAILGALGYREAFRCEKYREEYALADGVTAAVDETPIGVFVEIEGDEAAILEAATTLGRGPDDFILDSYPALYHAWCRARGLPAASMTFPASQR
jgi:adenylate cyclase class 2